MDSAEGNSFFGFQLVISDEPDCTDDSIVHSILQRKPASAGTGRALAIAARRAIVSS
jgi:hypothetical protein